jgi:uncharacterized protein
MEVPLMMRRLALLSAISLALCTVWSAPHASAQAQLATTDTNDWQQDLSLWRTAHERELAAPDGWLTLIGLEWLKPGLNSIGAAADNTIRIHAQAPDHIGLITLLGTPKSGQTVQLLSPRGGFPQDFQINGRAPREGTLSTGDANPSTMTWHGLSMVVLARGSGYALTIKDTDSPARNSFHGLHWFAPDPSYRVTARWIPYNPPQIEKIPTILGNTLNLPAPGVAEFLLKGKVMLLEPVIEGGNTNKLFFILSDETNKTTTYSSGRYLTTGVPDRGLTQPGSLTLDFNRLYNPPCAYTSYATCPMPPARNKLPVSIEAGERRYTQ